MSNKNFGKSFSGKGYYIALILCAVAIGISGYLYYQNVDKEEDIQLSNTDASAAVSATNDQLQEDLPVVATDPSTTPAPTISQNDTEVTKKPLQTGSPVEGQIVSVYAMDELGYNATTRDWRTHNGVDIAAAEGTAVCAAADGTVYTVYEDEIMGTTVVIRHASGYVTQYSSLAEDVSVKPGDAVKLGQQIGCVGSSALLESAIGDHVHFSVSRSDEPVDPAEFLAQ